jgi:hypothetical protein
MQTQPLIRTAQTGTRANIKSGFGQNEFTYLGLDL